MFKKTVCIFGATQSAKNTIRGGLPQINVCMGNALSNIDWP